MDDKMEQYLKLKSKQAVSEKYLWTELRNKKHEFKLLRRQQINYTRGGESKFFISDFLCPEKKLIIALCCDTSEELNKNDEAEEFLVENPGFTLLKFTYDMVLEKIEYVVKVIENELERKE